VLAFFASTFFYFFKNPQFLTIPSNKVIVPALILDHILNYFSHKIVIANFEGNLEESVVALER